MTDAPEKIWAEYGTGNWITSREEPRGDGQKASYIREDVALARVAAAYEGAAKRMKEKAEAAEAKLALAMEALEEIASDEHPAGWIAIAALAELKESPDDT